MSSDFNPYREWLSIPVSEQPANYYRLLGVPLFEPDLNVISNAADRQMSFIRTFQTGKYSEQSQRILNELATARVTLLDKHKKAEYDAKLRSEQNTESQSPSDNTPIHGLLNNNANKIFTALHKQTHSQQQSVPIAQPPSIPSRTPLLTPTSTLSIPSITPPPPAPLISHPFETPPTPPIPSTPQPSETPHTPSANPRTSPAFRTHLPKKSKKAPSPQPATSVQKTPAMNPSVSKKNWIAIIGALVVIPLLIGTGLLIQSSKTSSKENHAVQSIPDVSHDSPKKRPLKNRLPKEGNEAGERFVIDVDDVEFAFRWCPPGTFTMGSPESEDGRIAWDIPHQVTLTQGFWMLETEVTLAMFMAFVSDTGYESKGGMPFDVVDGYWKPDSNVSWRNPGFSQENRSPVTCVSWNDAMEFCKWLSEKTGENITLPTEAQWEYACRAGTTESLAGDMDDAAWYGLNSEISAHLVGTKKANEWGLYDMHGNVMEWCLDWFLKYLKISDTDPVGPSYGSHRVFRGGSWGRNNWRCRSEFRDGGIPECRSVDLGFRVLCSQAPPSESKVYYDTVISQCLKQTPESEDNLKAGERLTQVVNGVEIAFRWCPPGKFTMGSPIGEPGKDDMSKSHNLDFNKIEKQHKVTLSKGFWIMETEVTVGMFKAFVDETGYESKGSMPYGHVNNDILQDSRFSWRNPGFTQDDSHPVTSLSWDDAMAFCKWLTKKTGKIITLPTEAQWEYACRADSKTALPNGPIEIKGRYNAPALDSIAWYGGNSSHGFEGYSGMNSRAWPETQYPGGPCGTHPAAKKKPNNWGIYDMIGNVWEWCLDWQCDYPNESVTDPVGSASGFLRINRGSCWCFAARYSRSACRQSRPPEDRFNIIGFRCVINQ